MIPESERLPGEPSCDFKDGEDPDGDGADQQPHGERRRRQRAQRRHGEQGGLHSAQPQQEGELFVILLLPPCASSLIPQSIFQNAVALPSVMLTISNLYSLKAFWRGKQ